VYSSVFGEASMSASKRGVFANAANRVAAWLSANWAENKAEAASPAVTLALLSTLAPLPAAAQTAPVAIAPVIAAIAAVSDQTIPAANALTHTNFAELNLPASAAAFDKESVTRSARSQDYRFAARLAAVSKLNAPSSRAARHPRLAAPAHRAVPISRAAEIKIMKETRLPTAFAARTLTKKSGGNGGGEDRAGSHRMGTLFDDDAIIVAKNLTPSRKPPKI
jgi:hypothetical protein